MGWAERANPNSLRNRNYSILPQQQRSQKAPMLHKNENFFTRFIKRIS